MAFGEDPRKTSRLMEKWDKVLNHDKQAPITDKYKKAVIAQLMENTANEMEVSRQHLLAEDAYAPTNSVGNGSAIANYDPILISLIRRALPNMMPFDTMGVQPMTGPVGLIFAMRTRYNNQTGDEAFYNEANSIFSGLASDGTLGSKTQAGTGKAPDGSDVISNPVTNLTNDNAYTSGQGMPTATAETLGSDDTAAPFGQMALTIEKITATAKSRALKAEYSIEMAQDLKAIHGLDAESELANMLSAEILAEINRECIRTIYHVAKVGAQVGTTTAGYFDMDTDSNGRWSVERFKGLIYQIEREANAIAKATRRGKGNVMIVSSDVASALAMAGVLDYTPALNADLTVDDTGNTFAGLLHKRIKVYIDPYYGGVANNQDLVCVGYKGRDAKDAGLFYCPYVPLQMVRAVDQETFQPKIGFKTRYAMVANPFAEGLDKGNGVLNAHKNVYYRIFGVKNLM